jgi:DNA-binding IclR family transcriptional regulator
LRRASQLLVLLSGGPRGRDFGDRLRGDVEVISGVRHAADVLGLFTRAQPEWGASNVARALQISRSHAHRLLATLAEVGLLDKTQPGGRFRLSWTWLAYAEVLLASDPLVCTAVPVLRALQQSHDVELMLGVWAQGSIMSLRPTSVPMITPLATAHSLLPTITLMAEPPNEPLDRLPTHPGTVHEGLPQGAKLADCIRKVRATGLLTKADLDEPKSYWEAAATVLDNNGHTVAAVAARTADTQSMDPLRAAAAAKRAAELLRASLRRHDDIVLTSAKTDNRANPPAGAEPARDATRAMPAR